MARSRPAAKADSTYSTPPPTTPRTSQPQPSLVTAGAAPVASGAVAASASASGTASASTSRPTRSSARRQSGRASARASSPVAAAAGSPAAGSSSTPPAGPSHASRSSISKSHVEPKAHGLRNSSSNRERRPCPFPSEFGGADMCGLTEEDEADEALMAICAACATMNNVALSPDELASITIDNGWLRPPSVAVAPATMIANVIRLHQSRCQKASPKPRPSLLQKYQLAGSMAEAVLAPALHPDAFDGPVRPKGPVWFLSQDVGRTKWRNPFAGIVVPKAPVRKPAAPKPKAKPAAKKDDKVKTKRSGSTRKDKESTAERRSTPPAQPGIPKIKLRLSAPAANGSTTAPSSPVPGDESDLDVSGNVTPNLSRASSVDMSSTDRANTPLSSTLCTPVKLPKPRRHRPSLNVFDSSESESSESEAEVAPPSAQQQRRQRRVTLPAAAVNSGTRFPSITSSKVHSTFGELFFSPVQAAQPLPKEHHSPFPCHSLDNTIWGARRIIDNERFAFETSSSSSDDELAGTDWGTGSGLLIKAEDEELPVGWQQEENDDAKVNAATNAMRELFPYVPEATTTSEPVFNQLDNRPAPSDSSSVADSSSAATATAVFQGKLKSAACPAALPIWTLTSPVSSPNALGRQLPMFQEASPLQSRLTRDYDDRITDRTMEIDVDVSMAATAAGDESWLDESGHLPVHAEEVYSDAEVEESTTIDEVSTPERDRHLQTAEWAREAANATTELIIKQEPEDFYPSPAATSSTDPDENAIHFLQGSRESTVLSQSPSSGSSDLPPYELVSDYTQEFLLGPESVGMDELDSWLPAAVAAKERTPHKGRRGRPARNDPCRSSGSWGGIGVNNPVVPHSFAAVSSTTKPTPPPLVRKRSLRSSHNRRNRSSVRKAESRLTTAPTPTGDTDVADIVVLDCQPSQPEPVDIVIEADVDMEPDAIGPDELEHARAEAEEREELHRAKKRAEAEESKRRWDACRKAFADAAAESSGPASDPHSPVNESGTCTPWDLSGAWTSSDSIADLALVTPSTLSPLALQMGPTDFTGISLDPKTLYAVQPHDVDMDLSLVMTPEELEATAAQVPQPVPQPAGQPQPKVIAAKPQAQLPAQPPAQPTTAAPPVAQLQRVSTVSQGPSPPTPAPVVNTVPAKPVASAPQPVQPRPHSVPVPIAPAPVTAAAQAVPPVAAPTGSVARVLPVKAKSVPTPATVGAAPTAPTVLAPARTVSPVARTASASPASSVSSTPTLSSSSSASASPRPATPSGGTTKRLLPGIDACVIDNLPCYSHVFEVPQGGRCTVLRRLDTDFVNGTALLTALGLPPQKQGELLSAPSPTLSSHRTVPLIGQGGLHHAPGVPGVWIPLVEARDIAKRLGLPDTRLLANILREDLFQLFKELAGISLRHTSSNESFGMPFSPQPYPRVGQAGRPGARPATGTPTGAQTPVQQQAKSPLVRLPAGPPDGCPQPKRRRPTVVLSAQPPQMRAQVQAQAQAAPTQQGKPQPAQKTPVPVRPPPAARVVPIQATAMAPSAPAAKANVAAPGASAAVPAAAAVPSRPILAPAQTPATTKGQVQAPVPVARQPTSTPQAATRVNPPTAVPSAGAAATQIPRSTVTPTTAATALAPSLPVTRSTPSTTPATRVTPSTAHVTRGPAPAQTPPPSAPATRSSSALSSPAAATAAPVTRRTRASVAAK